MISRREFIGISRRLFILKTFGAGIGLFGCEQSHFSEQHLFRSTSAETVSSPVASDFELDGRMEIALGSFDGSCYLLDDSLNVCTGWPQECAGGFFSSPALWDVDRDGTSEIFIGGNDGKLHGWRVNGSPVPGFPIDLGFQCWSSPVIVADSLIAIGGYEKMFVFDRGGRAVVGWPQEINGWAAASAAWRDEVLAISTLTRGETSRGHLYVWQLSGEAWPNFPVRLKMDSDSSPALADLDRDGVMEIIVGDDGGFLHVFKLDGSELPPFPRLVGEAIQGSVAVADLDHDEVLDMVFGTTDGAVHVWNALGDCALGWPVRTGHEINASPALVEIENGEFRIIIGSGDERLYVLRPEGKHEVGFPVDCGAAIHSSPLVIDLDGNGRREIVFGANNGIHLLKDVLSIAPAHSDAVEWSMFRHNARRTGSPSNTLTSRPAGSW
ncbi:MAG: FG-GAP repeat domain-containing protein [bacterium]